MDDSLASIPTPYKGLQVKSEDVFPFACPQCQRRFTDLKDYIARTTPMRSAPGLAEFAEPAGTFVLLVRTCLCGSSLTLQCRDRRDQSTDGVLRRSRYDSLVSLLTETGIPQRQAETEVRRLLALMAP